MPVDSGAVLKIVAEMRGIISELEALADKCSELAQPVPDNPHVPDPQSGTDLSKLAFSLSPPQHLGKFNPHGKDMYGMDFPKFFAPIDIKGKASAVVMVDAQDEPLEGGNMRLVCQSDHDNGRNEWQAENKIGRYPASFYLRAELSGGKRRWFRIADREKIHKNFGGEQQAKLMFAEAG